MIKLTGLEKKKIAIFISGKGSNLKNLIKFSKKKKSSINVALIISNKKNAKGLIYASRFKIKKKIISFKNNTQAENRILNELNLKKIKIVCLAGFMKILSNRFLKKFNGKIINIHPSLLPKYKGLNTHEKVIKNKEKFSGCTVHLVNSKLDSGKIIMQKKVKVYKHDTSKTLGKRILKEEHKLYPLALTKFLSSF